GYLHHAVLNAYDGLLKDGIQPSYFIYLTVPPHTLDINIHPTKTEVKFDDEQSLYAILRSTVKHSLGQFNIAPVLDFDKDATLDIPYDFKDKESETPTIEVRSDFNPFTSDTKSSKTSNNSGFSYQKSSAKTNASWESLYVGLQEEQFIGEVQTEQYIG